MAHETSKTYLLGFALSLLLTLAAFGMVEAHVLSGHTVFAHELLYSAIAVFAVLQFAVQLIFFLHLGRRGNTLNVVAFAFAAVLVGIVVGGALWIMASLNSRMMPGPDQMLQYMQDQSSAL